MLTITSFLADPENDNVDDFMEDMNSLLSQETEINFKSIIEDESITDLSQSISDNILGDFSLVNGSQEETADNLGISAAVKVQIERETNNLKSKNQDSKQVLKESTDVVKNKESVSIEQNQENLNTLEPNISVEHEKKIKNRKSIISEELQAESKSITDLGLNNVVRRHPKYASTCHCCKAKKSSRKVKCQNKKCKVEICSSCLRKAGEDYQRALIDASWQCFVCRKVCKCKVCSVKMDEEKTRKEEEYQRFVNNWNKKLKEFSWSRRNYSVKVSNIGEEEKYQKILKQFKPIRGHTLAKEKDVSAGPYTQTPALSGDKRKSSSQRPTRKGRGVGLKEGEALQKLLSYLLGLLMKKDSNKWFSVPIDDKMAPGYSDVVKEKMDFTKMENKLDSFAYCTLAQFKDDFNLICQNCMKFNKSETCYHKSAKKLEGFGNQLLSKKSLRDIVLDRPLYSSITPYEIGFDVFDMNDNDDETTTKPSTSKVKSRTDNETPKKGTKVPSESHGNEIEDLFISAAERVKFGRKRNMMNELRSSIDDSPSTKISQDKKKVSKKDSLEKIKEIEASDNSDSSTPLVHHDYLTSINNNTDSEDNDSSVKSTTVDKIKNLHKEKAEGTYVQCCVEECKRWRFLTEFEDPSEVPEYWDCSMNKDTTANKCSIGDDDDQPDDDDVEFVNVRFTCGSLAWARVKGYPWWPVIIDYCPDSEEYYWIEVNIQEKYVNLNGKKL